MGILMKKVVIFLLLATIICFMPFVYGCKKAEEPEPPEKTSLSQEPDELGFNPDEPAPVPEGTPPY